MNQNEVRYQLVSALLQASEPLTLDELVDCCNVQNHDILPVLRKLVIDGLVVEGQLTPDKVSPQFFWGARWEREIQRRSAESKQKLRTIATPTKMMSDRSLDVDSEPVLALYNYVINEYKPPENKKFLVFLQCSVRRPFSSSPSHASMRRAIAVATGYDPKKDFYSCPVHVVVMASKIGPVPYELEDAYPANVRGGGVKHFDKKYYYKVKPVLATRVARYIVIHGKHYKQISTFTEGRYGEVMESARLICNADFRILPVLDGPQIMRKGNSIPRNYWEKYWIQLYLEILSWLSPTQRMQAEERLKKMDVEYL